MNNENGGEGSNGKPEGDFADEDPTNAFAENEPTHASRPPPEMPLPGDLPPEELADLNERSPFDESDAQDPLSDPNATVDQEPASDEPSNPGQPPPSQDAAPGFLSPRLESIVESLLFVADKPVGLKNLAELVGEAEIAHVKSAVEAVEERYRERGIQLHAVAGGWQFRSNPENAAWVQKLLQQKPVRLSRAQLETLAIVAYRQPITRPEIDQIRGVDSGGTLKTLMDRSLVRILGKKEEPGRPMLYGTSKEFLDFFSLHDLKDLPTLREFHELTEEHKAQVAALESAAPEGSVETEEEARAAELMEKPLERMELKPTIDDSKELEEIDRLIASANVNLAEPAPASAPDTAPADPEQKTD